MKRVRNRPGFSLIELTVALALVAILLTLVVVRVGVFTPRQRLIHEARKLGQTIETYRELAATQEGLYVLVLDPQTGTFQVRKPVERNLELLERAPLIRAGRLEEVHVKTMRVKAQALTGPLTLTFDSNGIQPAWTMELAHASGVGLYLHVDPMVNEVRYDEK